MKNLAPILVFVFAFTFTTQAQKKREHKRPQLTVAQQTELAVKKMTLALNLTEKQQLQLKPLILDKIAEKKAFIAKRKKAEKEKKRPTSDAIYAMKIKILDQKIAMKKSMKDILNTTQFQKFEKMHKKRMMKGKKMKAKKDRKRNKIRDSK